MSTQAANSPEVVKVYTSATQEVMDRYGDRLEAVYLIGSLAHGGFSETTSDIDVAFIINQPEITESDWNSFAESDATVKESPLAYGSRLSVFWTTRQVLETELTSGAFPAPTREHGVFPPYDVLDLVQNGVLIHGEEVRENFRHPTQDELYTAGVEFLLSYVNTDENNTAITDFAKFDASSNHDKSKLILFPVRLLYTLESGSVSENAQAAEDYLSGLSATWATGGFRDEDANVYALIREAMNIRQDDTYDQEAMEENFAGLRELYSRLLAKHAEKMLELGKQDYAAQLEEWKLLLQHPTTQHDEIAG